jgi:hypothetical protein
MKFRMNVVALGVLAALGSGQVMAQNATSAGTLRLQGNDTGLATGTLGVEISSNLNGVVGAADQAYVTVYTSGNASVVGTTQAQMLSGANSIVTNATTGNTITGATNINTTTAGAVTIGSTANGQSTTVLGVTNINATGGYATVIGNSADSNNTVTISGGDGVSINNNVAGTTNIGTGAASTTNIGTGSAASTVKVGNSASTVRLLGATTINTTGTATTTIGNSTGNVSLNSSKLTNVAAGTAGTDGVNLTQVNTLISAAQNTGATGATGVAGVAGVAGATGATGATGAAGRDGKDASLSNMVGAASINTTGSAATTIGSTDLASTTTLRGGASILAIGSGSASLTSGNGSGMVAFSSTQTVNGAGLSNGNDASRAAVNGASVRNVIAGNTLIDGNLYVNGAINYASNTSSSNTVTGGRSVVGGGTTSASSTITNAGGTGATVDKNGKITNAAVGQTTAALTVTNGEGNVHGYSVNETSATMSGGVRSTSLTLDDSGARFSNSANGAPVTVTGVADGSGGYDAINVRQLGGAIAAVTATANIPQVDQGKTFAVGVGLGSYLGSQALAFGATYRLDTNLVVKASIASGTSSGSRPATGVGVAWSF